MPTPDGLKKFYQKRGFKVGGVIETDVGFAVWIDRPAEARKVFDSVADTTNLVFISHKTLWQKLQFWRK